MWRAVLGFLVVAITAIVAINLLITTDLERVEGEVERLLEVARQGGDEAVAEILAAFADDYRGAGFFARDRVAGYLRTYVGEKRITSLTSGDVKAVWKGEEILVPILSVRAETERETINPVFRVTFAERDGRWRIIDAERWRLER